MHIEGVAVTPAALSLRRTGCRLTKLVGRPHLASDDLDELPEVVFYCPACAERELGGD
jgi:hypothetical protein